MNACGGNCSGKDRKTQINVSASRHFVRRITRSGGSVRSDKSSKFTIKPESRPLKKKITHTPRVIAVEYMKKTLSVRRGWMCLGAALIITHRPRAISLLHAGSTRGGGERKKKRTKFEKENLPEEFVDMLSLSPPSWSAGWCTCAPVKTDAWRSAAVCCSWTSSWRASPIKVHGNEGGNQRRRELEK